MLEIVDGDDLLVRVDHPVFPYTGIHVLVQLDDHVLLFGGRGENFQNEIGCAVDAALDDLVPVTDDDDVRFDHGLVVTVKLHVDGRNHREAVAVLTGDVVK